MEYFLDECVFGYRALDIQSYAMSKMGVEFNQAKKPNFPRKWFDKGLTHTHSGIDDALLQGRLFINMLNDTD